MGSDISNITNFLGGGWLSVAIGVILVGLIIWWSFKKRAILIEAAKKQSDEQKTKTEQEEIQKGISQDTVDREGAKAIDDFMEK